MWSPALCASSAVESAVGVGVVGARARERVAAPVLLGGAGADADALLLCDLRLTPTAMGVTGLVVEESWGMSAAAGRIGLRSEYSLS